MSKPEGRKPGDERDWSLVASDGVAEVSADVRDPGPVPFLPWSPL